MTASKMTGMIGGQCVGDALIGDYVVPLGAYRGLWEVLGVSFRGSSA